MSETTSPDNFGRVDADGTVYVITAEGERSVGQVPDVTPEEALEFFRKRFAALEVEVNLLETRIQKGALAPDGAREAIRALMTSVENANAVGDLAALGARLRALDPVLAEQTEARKAARAKQHAETRAAKELMVAEAEKLAASDDWRRGVNRFRELLDEWKALPRIDRTTDDELWHRFSSARTTYTRRRKAQFAEQAARRDVSQIVKERIIEEARELATSTAWGPTTGAFRDLMARWKAAGAAPREIDDKLWAEFRSLNDAFFTARNEANQAVDAEFKGNLEAKEALLAEAEATILPVTDLAAARSALRAFLEQYNAVGRVPREAMRSLDGRVRALDQAVKAAEDAEWKRTDPEARSRAEDTVNLLVSQIEKLTAKAAAAEARGDAKAAKKATDSIATYETWLESARATLAEFTR